MRYSFDSHDIHVCVENTWRENYVISSQYNIDTIAMYLYKWNILFDRMKFIKFCDEVFKLFYLKKRIKCRREIFMIFKNAYLKFPYFVTREMKREIENHDNIVQL